RRPAESLAVGLLCRAYKNMNMFKIIVASRQIRRMLGVERVQIIGIVEERYMNVSVCYASYLVISIVLTIWFARTLYRSGRVFLLDAFNGNADLSDSVNHLLVVAFYPLNVGYIALALKTTSALAT